MLPFNGFWIGGYHLCRSTKQALLSLMMHWKLWAHHPTTAPNTTFEVKPLLKQDNGFINMDHSYYEQNFNSWWTVFENISGRSILFLTGVRSMNDEIRYLTISTNPSHSTTSSEGDVLYHTATTCMPCPDACYCASSAASTKPLWVDFCEKKSQIGSAFHAVPLKIE